MAYDDYTPLLRQYRIDVRAPRFRLDGAEEIWVMNFDLGDERQWDLPVLANIDAYVFLGESHESPHYDRRDFAGAVVEAGAGTFLANLDALRVTIRPLDNFDAPPFVDIAITSPTEVTVTALRNWAPSTSLDLDLTTAPIKAYAMPFRVDGAVLRDVLAALNASASGGGAALPALMSIEWTRDGFTQRTRPFAVQLIQ